MFAVIAVPLLLMASVASSQPPVAELNRPENWDFSQRIELETISAFAAAPTGLLWMATRGGLRRWDGYELIRMLPGQVGVPSSEVFALAPGTGERMWASLGGGFVGCENVAGRWNCRHTAVGGPKVMVVKSWLQNGEPRLSGFAIVLPPPALEGVPISGVAETNTALWLGSARGLYRTDVPLATTWPPSLAGQTAQQVPLGVDQQTVLGIRKRHDGSLLVNTVSGLFEIHDTNVKQLWQGPVTTVAEDAQGAIWFGTPTGLRKVDASADFVLDANHGLPDNMIQALAFDAQGGLWVGTRNGLVRVQGEELVNLTASLPHPDVTALQLDSDEGMWVALRAGGAVRAQRKLVSNFGPKQGLPPFGINGIATNQEGLWISTQTALYLRAPASAVWAKQDVLPQVKTVPAFQGFARDAHAGLWLADVGRGLWQREGHAWVLWKSPQLSLLPGPWAVAFDHQGRVWVGGNQGAMLVFHLGSEASHELTWIAEHQPPPGAACLAPITSILPLAEGALLVGTDGGGLWSLDSNTIRCLGSEMGLKHRRIGAMVTEGSGAWMGSPEGSLTYFDGKRFRPLTESDGLPCDAISALQTVGSRLWFTCGAGVGTVRLADLHARAEGGKARISHVHFNRGAAMSSEEPVLDARPGAVADAHGTYWSLNRAGLSAIALLNDERLPAPPRMEVEQVLINGVVHPLNNIFVRASDVDVEVRLHSRAISGLKATLFDKRLESGGGTRTDYSLLDRPVFRQLTPGTYTFTARARSPYGQWGPTTAPLQIVVAAPFHKQPWIFVVGAVLLAALAYAVHRSKLRRVASRYQVVQNERERIARDLHDGLGQGFMALRFALETLRRSLGTPSKQTVELLGQSTDILRQVENESRQTIWNLRAKALGGESLGISLHQLAQRTESRIIGGGVRVLVEVNGQPETVDSMTNAELLSVAGEAVMNAVNHAHAHEIHITLDVTATEVRLAVYDNGRGFQSEAEPDAASGHFGLLGMRERLRRLHGAITIESIPGEGTAVVATVPRLNAKETS